MLKQVQHDKNRTFSCWRDTKKWTLINQIKQNVAPKAHVMTDDLSSYRHLYKHGFYKHYSVNHSDREYVRHHLFHANNVEGLWSHIKRGVYGVSYIEK